MRTARGYTSADRAFRRKARDGTTSSGGPARPRRGNSRGSGRHCRGGATIRRRCVQVPRTGAPRGRPGGRGHAAAGRRDRTRSPPPDRNGGVLGTGGGGRVGSGGRRV